MSLAPILGMMRGYGLGIAVEAPILLVFLSRRHTWKQRLFAGVWLTACSYPIVYMAMPAIPLISQSRGLYGVVAETFAAASECAIFWWAFDRRVSGRREIARNCLVIIAANVASFLAGEAVVALYPHFFTA